MPEAIHSAFTVLWSQFFAMDHNEIMSNWKHIIDCYGCFIAEHSNGDSELHFEAVRARNVNIRVQTLDGVVDFNFTEDLFQKDITKWENCTHSTSFETVCLKRGLSALYCTHQRHDGLHRIITEIVPWTAASVLEILGGAAVEQRNFGQAIEPYNAWLAWCMDTVGVGHDTTARASICLEDVLRDFGDMDQAEIAGGQSEMSFDALCVRLGELEIQETCDEEGLDGNEVEWVWHFR